MKARKEVMELDPYVPGRSKEEIAQEFGVKKEDVKSEYFMSLV